MTLAVIKQRGIAENFHKLLPRETDFCDTEENFKQQIALRKEFL